MCNKDKTKLEQANGFMLLQTHGLVHMESGMSLFILSSATVTDPDMFQSCLANENSVQHQHRKHSEFVQDFHMNLD